MDLSRDDRWSSVDADGDPGEVAGLCEVARRGLLTLVGGAGVDLGDVDCLGRRGVGDLLGVPPDGRGGASVVGPDLNRPMNPIEYFRPAALRRYLRDPASVRTWPEQKMPGFAPEQLGEAELDALLAYLEHMAERRPRETP